MNNTAEDIQDRMLSHVLKHHFSAITDSELESRLSQINKEIDSAGSKKAQNDISITENIQIGKPGEIPSHRICRICTWDLEPQGKLSGPCQKSLRRGFGI